MTNAQYWYWWSHPRSPRVGLAAEGEAVQVAPDGFEDESMISILTELLRQTQPLAKSAEGLSKNAESLPRILLGSYVSRNSY